MTRTSDPTNTPATPDPNTAALVRIVGLMAIVMLIALGYLMVKKSFDDADRAGRCIVFQTSAHLGPVPLECR